VTARAEFPNPGLKLKPGMLIRVSISRGQRQALAVPESAVSVQGDSAFVFLIRAAGPRGAMAEQRPVVTRLRPARLVGVRDGGQRGAGIVADGLTKVQAGQPIRVTAGRPGGPGGPGGPHGHPGQGGPDGRYHGPGAGGAAGASGSNRGAPRPGGGQPTQ